MTKSVADKTPISATLRRHIDPPGMWVAVLLCSAMLHASAFLILRSLDFDSFKPKRLTSSIPIEIVRVPKKQIRTRPRVIAQRQPKTLIQSPSKPVPVKPQATTPQVTSTVLPATQQQDAIAFGNPSFKKNTPTPTPKTQPSTKPKVEQKVLPKPQLKNQAELQRQQKLALQRQKQAQRQRDIAAQRQRDIAEQRQRDIGAQRQRDIAEQRQRDIAEQRQQDIAAQRQQDIAAQRQRDIAKNQSEVPTSSDSVVVDKNPPPPPDGKIATNNETTGGFLTASLSVLPNNEQQTNLNLTAGVKFIPEMKQKTITPNKLPLLDEKDRQLITQPIICPVILSIDANGKIFKDKGIIIPDDAPQKDICKRYAEEYFQQNRGNIEFRPGRNSANKPVSSGLWVEIQIQPLTVDKKIPN
jgi:hypothetical protein